MKWILAAVIAATVGLLLTSDSAFGQDDRRPREYARPVANGALPTDAKTLAIMYRKTLDGYRGLAAGYIFQTHLGIGMIAELAANKVYSADQATTALDRMTGGMTAMQPLLKVVSSLKLPDSDRKTILSIMTLSAKVDAQAKALSKYLLSNSQTDANAYHKLRADTASEIGKFLGIG